MSNHSIVFYSVIIVLCSLSKSNSGQYVSPTFLGPREVSKIPSDGQELILTHSDRVGSHILAMKGLLSSLDTGTMPLDSEGIFDHPSLLNMSLLMIFVFIAIVSVISGTAGLVLFVNSVNLRSGDCRKFTTPVNGMDTIEKSNSNMILSHPGCLRIVGKDSHDTMSHTVPINAFLACRE